MQNRLMILFVGIVCLMLAVPSGAARAKRKDTTMELSPLETQVLGQNRWLRGGPAALRVIVSDHQSGKPIRATVNLWLTRLENGKPVSAPTQIFSGHTNTLGTLDAHFRAPAAKPGPYELEVAVNSPLGKESVKQPIQLQESVQLLLTADKPLYQPGQTMHLRALALDMATRQTLGGVPVVFEIEDARGNKVFKRRETLSAYGIASADFVLADEVNMGTFTLRAVLPEGQTEKKVRVERYVLPKFKVALTTDRPYYLPGETVAGTLKANYFFGKPVAGGQVTVEVNTVDIGVTKLGELTGTTDASGVYHFRYTLPNAFVGQPFEQGKAVVEFHATLKDTADHRQDAHTTIPVVKEPILLVVVPESRALVPDVPNRVYIAAATPDGAPLKVALEVAADHGGHPATLTTDDLGLATYTFTPGTQPVTLTVRGRDANGHTATVQQALQAAPQQEGVILRTDRTLARAGERLSMTILSSVKTGTIYLDVLRNRQTILTRAEPVEDGQAHLTLPLTEDMAGTLEIHAYKILPNEDIIRDTRLVVVSPTSDLSVKVTADKGQYRPGEDAHLRFTVQDAQQHPVTAALGLAMVDESVFALSELQPGLEKIYFTLERELMEPKYEIHGLRPVGLLLNGVRANEPAEKAAERQRAAAMLFAAVPPRSDFDFKVNTYQARWEKVKEQVVEEMVKAHQKILNALNRYHSDTKTLLHADDSLMLLVEKGYLRDADLKDRWGHYYRTNLYGRNTYDGYFALSSAGPDGRWGTVDDIVDVSMYYRGGREFGLVRRMNGGLAAGRAGGPGGFGGGGAENMVMDKAAMPMMLAEASAPSNVPSRSGGKDGGASGAGEPVRVREYFPETMYWNPSLITDALGQAEVRIPMADSITTWRLSMMANSIQGLLGSATAPIKVFQDFFVDIDLPIALTQHDHVEIPVAVYNYLPTAQDVALTLDEQDWFTLDGSAKQTTHVDAGQVKVVTYAITVKSIGRFTLTVTARGTKLSDAVRRGIDVLPDGKEFVATINDRLEGTVDKTVAIPEEAIHGASAIWVKLYPGAFSQVVEGLDGILRMPNGCFEQTSSTTYPNVLVLDYLKQAKRINPELQMKAEGYINVGYQRLVTFECKNGGFSWFGNEPAHQVLTAYGLLEFSDMAKVHDVDPALIQRTQQWLAGRQKADGTWEETNQGIAEGIINRQTGALRTTAYVAWALAESGYEGPQLARGIDYVKTHQGEAKDPYTLALILNLLARVERDGEAAVQAADALIALAKTTDKTAYWQTDTPTFTGAVEKGADLETTGLAAYGLVKWGRNGNFTNKVLTYLVQSKDSFGTWSSTQGTVWSMKALLFASRNAVGGGNGTVTVLANGQQIASFSITPDDSDVMRQISLGSHLKEGANAIHLEYHGEGSLLYQIAGRYYIPWDRIAAPALEREVLSLRVDYDKTTLAQDDVATVTAQIHNNTDRIAEMPLIDLGVPPGFTVIPDRLDAAVQAKTISKYTLAARQVIVYLEKLDPGQTVTLTYQIKARFPIKARTPLSKAYPYYNPEKVAVSAPQDILVQK